MFFAGFPCVVGILGGGTSDYDLSPPGIPPPAAAGISLIALPPHKMQNAKCKNAKFSFQSLAAFSLQASVSRLSNYDRH